MYEFEPDWLAKVEAMRADGHEPWPNGFRVSHLSTEIHARFVGVEVPAGGLAAVP